MDLDGSFGLTTLLLGQRRPRRRRPALARDDLHVLPCGPVPPNPSELLGSEPMEALFGKLSHDFDFILVDSPPVVPVIDAVLINKLTHGLIMVVAADRTRKRDLASAVQSLETVDSTSRRFRTQHGAGHLHGPPLRLLRLQPGGRPEDEPPPAPKESRHS